MKSFGAFTHLNLVRLSKEEPKRVESSAKIEHQGKGARRSMKRLEGKHQRGYYYTVNIFVVLNAYQYYY